MAKRDARRVWHGTRSRPLRAALSSPRDLSPPLVRHTSEPDDSVHERWWSLDSGLRVGMEGPTYEAAVKKPFSTSFSLPCHAQTVAALAHKMWCARGKFEGVDLRSAAATAVQSSDVGAPSKYTESKRAQGGLVIETRALLARSLRSYAQRPKRGRRRGSCREKNKKRASSRQLKRSRAHPLTGGCPTALAPKTTWCKTTPLHGASSSRGVFPI